MCFDPLIQKEHEVYKMDSKHRSCTLYFTEIVTWKKKLEMQMSIFGPSLLVYKNYSVAPFSLRIVISLGRAVVHKD